MTEDEERAYSQGNKQAYANMLEICLRGLGGDNSTEAERVAWVAERHAAIVILRDLCGEFGDNNWPDSLYLADIIEKHLAKHLWRREVK